MFIYFVNKAKSIKRKGISYKYIYKKKIQQTPKKKGINRYLTHISSKKNSQSKINKNSNMKYFNTSILRSKIIINKTMNNKIEDILNDEIKNIFILPYHPKKNIIHKKDVIINHSYKKTEPNNNLVQAPIIHNYLKNNVNGKHQIIYINFFQVRLFEVWLIHLV